MVMMMTVMIMMMKNKNNTKMQYDNESVDEGEDEEDLPSTASEWVFTTKSGNLASVVDLSFGVGLEILK